MRQTRACRAKSKSRRKPDGTRLRPIWPNGARLALTDDSMYPYGCTTKIRTPTDPHGTPTSPDETQWNPSDFSLWLGSTTCDTERRSLTTPLWLVPPGMK